LKDYKKTIEAELSAFCNEIIDLIDNYLVKNAGDSETKVFYLKMKADYFRYISEYA